MTAPIFLDTNVLVYLFDNASPTKQQRARGILEETTRAGTVLLSTQVLQEFYVAVTRKLSKPLDEKTAEQAVRDLSLLPIVRIDSALVLTAISRSRSERLSFWDALIVEAALAGGAKRLYSEDLQDGRSISGLRIENPFARK
jgi:predicted nucleic acid-binding protein